MQADDRLSSAFAALADATRRDILNRLRTGSMTVSKLAEHYSISRPAISQHLRVLEKTGLVQRTRRAQWQEYSLAEDSLAEVATWVQRQRNEWNERFDRLETYLGKEHSDD